MKCQHCGREAQPGQVYCECGHPISLSGGTMENYAQNNGFAQMQQNQGFYDYNNMMTPDGRDLASLQKKPGLSAGAKILLMLLVIVIIGVCGFVAFMIIKGGDELDENNWKKIDKSEFTITIPESFKESDNLIELDNEYTKLGYFKGKNAGVYISRSDFSAQEQSVIKQQGLAAMKKTMIEIGSRRKINGQQITVKERGDLLVTEFPATRKNYISGTDKLWVVDASLVLEDRLYEIEAYCAESEKDKYSEAMYKWIDSFKSK